MSSSKRRDVVQPSALEAQADAEVVSVVLVRFLKRDAPFNEGDVRPFPPLEARKFIRQGVAEEVVIG